MSPVNSTGLGAVLAVGLMIVAFAQSASAQPAEGDWLGSLAATPALTLRLAVHIHKTPQAGWTGTMDSPDQGAYDRPLAEVTAGPDALSFAVPATGAHFAGKWDPARHAWLGQWTQGPRSVELDLAPGVVPPAPRVAGVDGDWDGTLDAALGVRLRLALHIETSAHGTTGLLDSVDQQAKVGVSTISRDGDQVRIEVKPIFAVFEATLDPAGKTLTGRFIQAGKPTPLTLARRAAGQATATLKRPQTPVKPYPYREEEIAFDGAAAKVRLAGTLTLPKGEGPFPVAVLVSGSGPNTRNEPIFGHQIFLVIADHLTRQGIAVLRYDKRGTGSSSGDYAKATTVDFADDAAAAAAVAYLRTRKDIDPRRIGLIGHSEGGLIVPMVAARDPSVAFIVMMAGPGVNGFDVMMEQGRLIMKAAGVDEEQIAKSVALRSQMFTIARSEKDPVAAAAKLRVAITAASKAQGLPDKLIDAEVSQINSDWFRFFFAYDPAPTLRQVKCPVLALNGGLDLQVPPAQNLPAIRVALAQNHDAEVDELPGLNHLFQTAKTGGVGEYGQIKETIAPAALDVMTRWLLKRVGEPRPD